MYVEIRFKLSPARCFTMEPLKQCNVAWHLDPEDGWKLRLTGDCAETLKQIESLPSRKRQYLKRRIEVEDYEPPASSASSTAS